MTFESATYPGYRFPAEVIQHAAWLYHVFSLSLRDVELILAERGVTVTHESIRQWCLTFGGESARRLRRGDRIRAGKRILERGVKRALALRAFRRVVRYFLPALLDPTRIVISAGRKSRSFTERLH